MAVDDDDHQQEVERILARRQERLGISREEALRPSEEPPLFLQEEERRARETGCDPAELLRRDLEGMRDLPYPGPDCLQPDEVMAYADRELPAERLAHAEHCLECGALLRHAVLRPPELPREQRVPAAVPRRPWAPPVWSPALVTACLLLLVGLFQWVKQPQGGLLFRPPTVIAVLSNTASRESSVVRGITAALSQIMSAELALVSAERRIVVEPWDRAADLSLTLADQDLAAIPSARLQTLKHGLGADALVLCSGKVEGSRVVLTMEIAQGEKQEKRSFAVASMASVPESAYQAGQWALERLGLSAASPPRGPSERYAMPVNAEAFRDFSAGLAHRAGGQPAEAVRLLKAAVQHEEHPLVYAALADAWSQLGDKREERQNIRMAVDRADRYPLLPDYERKALKGRYFVAFSQWENAAQVYSDLEKASPNRVDSSIRLAETYLAMSDAKSALDKIADLRKSELSALDKARLNLLEAKAADILSDPGRQQRAALEAAAIGQRLGARRLEAEASLQAGRAARDQGRDAATLFQRAWDLSHEIDDENGCAAARFEQGVTAFLVEHNEKRAESLFREALATFEAQENRGGVARAQLRLGHLDDLHDPPRDARPAYKKALEIFTDLGDRQGIGQALLSRGILRWSRFRDFKAAESDYAAARKQFQEISDRGGEARVLSDQGQLLMERGKVGEAREALEASLAIRKEAGLRRDEAASHVALAEALVYAGDLSDAEEHYDAALSVYRKIYGKEVAKSPEAAQVRLRRALLWLEQEKLDAVGPELEKVQLLSTLPKAPKEYDAQLALAQLRLLQGKPAEAQAALPPGGARDTNWQIVAARIDLAAGRRAAAVSRLQPIVQAARTEGLVLVELEAGLALAEAQLGDQNADAARQELQKIQSQADEGGAKLLARKAANLLRPPGPRLSNSALSSLFSFLKGRG